MSDGYTLTLPVPPSVNTIYHHGVNGNVYKDHRATDYGWEVIGACMTAYGGRPVIDGLIALTVDLYLFDWADLDFDNSLKVTCDSLAACFGFNDKHIVHAIVRKHLVVSRDDVRCVVTIAPYREENGE